MELLLTGRPLPAPEALRWGLINRVVPAGQALSAALELAQEITANAPLAVQGSKRIAYAATDGRRHGEFPYWNVTDQVAAWIITTEDALEGPTAFAEKRAPVWKAR
jgi:crotonobetainyl-CoA hydratase